MLKFWYWIIFRPQNQTENRPVRHTVLKQLEKNVDSTSRRWFNVWWMLDQLCLPNWQALSVAKPRLLCWILNSLTSRQKLLPLRQIMFKLLKNENLEIYLHHMIARLYFPFRSSIYLFLFYFFSAYQAGWSNPHGIWFNFNIFYLHGSF